MITGQCCYLWYFFEYVYFTVFLKTRNKPMSSHLFLIITLFIHCVPCLHFNETITELLRAPLEKASGKGKAPSNMVMV